MSDKQFPETMVIKRFLPIGTVVKIKDDTNTYMITAQMMKHPRGEEDILYDYMACLYPIGVLNNDMNYFFYDEEISDIYHYGYIDDEEFFENLKYQNIYSKINIHPED